MFVGAVGGSRGSPMHSAMRFMIHRAYFPNLLSHMQHLAGHTACHTQRALCKLLGVPHGLLDRVSHSACHRAFSSLRACTLSSSGSSHFYDICIFYFQMSYILCNWVSGEPCTVICLGIICNANPSGGIMPSTLYALVPQLLRNWVSGESAQIP